MKTFSTMFLSLLIILIISQIGFAQAIPPPAAAPPPPQQVPGPPPGGPSMGMPGGGMGMQMMPMMHPAITVDNTAVYVIRGNEVLKLDKNTLQVLQRTVLPPMQMPGPPPPGSVR